VHIANINNLVEINTHGHILYNIKAIFFRAYYDSQYIYFSDYRNFVCMDYKNRSIIPLTICTQHSIVSDKILPEIVHIHNNIIYTAELKEQYVNNLFVCINGKMTNKYNFFNMRMHRTDIRSMLVGTDGVITLSVQDYNKKEDCISRIKFNDSTDIWFMKCNTYTQILLSDEYEIIYVKCSRINHIVCFDKFNRKKYTCEFPMTCHRIENMRTMCLANEYGTNIYTLRTK